MFSPHDDMPPLVDPNGPFIPPPPGVSSGGQPGFFDAFPGAQASTYPWPPTSSGTPYPHAQQNPLPNWPPATSPGGYPPHSAVSWTYGQYQPFNNTPALSWGAATPAGSYGPHTPITSANPFGGGGYTPWTAPPTMQQYGSVYVPPVVQDSGFSQPITSGGFFGAGVGSGGMVENGQGLAVGWDTGVMDVVRKKKRSNSMKRSNSTGPSPKRTPLQRTLSFGNPAAAAPFGNPYPPMYPYGPSYPATDAYDARNLARRPRDWRADYSPRLGLSSLMPRVGKSRSDVREYVDETRRVLHPLLQFNANHPPIDHDLRDNPVAATEYPMFTNLGRPHNTIDFAQLATQPAAPMMRLFHPSLPWYIDVRPSHPNGVTVYDILAQIYRQLMLPINGRHFWNEDLTDVDRAAISSGFQERCKGSAGEIQRGVLQVDFLGKRVIMEGLIRGRNGNYEIKTRKDE